MGMEAGDQDVAEQDLADVAGVRLYTRAPVTLPWLGGSVVPVARALHDSGSTMVYLRRGWLHGPHVDIVARGVMGRKPAWRDIAAQLDAGALAADKALTEDAYLAQAREFGRLERVSPPYLPMAEHGTVEFLGPDDIGSQQQVLTGLRELEVVNSALCAPLMSTIDELSLHPSRATVRLAEAFVALADSYFLGLAYGVFSFRSHAEAFLAWAAPTKDVRPAFAERLAREASDLRPLVEQRISGDVSPAAAAWRTAFAYCAGALDSAVMGGGLTLEMLDSIGAGADLTGMGPPTAPEVVPQGSHPDSAFHHALAASGAIDEPTQWFAAYRVLINLFYQQLPLLTVSPMQRYYTCYAIAELVDEVLGESWQERLDRDQVRVAGGPRRMRTSPTHRHDRGDRK